MELDASLSWLALALTPGLACRLSARLLRKFGSPDRIFHASLTELEGCSLPALVAQAIVNKDAFKRAEKELAGIRNIAGCRLINWTEPEYPRPCCKSTIRRCCSTCAATRRSLISRASALSALADRPCTARKWWNDWAAIWQRVAWRFSVAGAGVDAIGHQGALAANGRAIGVLGTGIDICYPKENKKLYEKVLERGAILSEFPLGTHPAPESFPIRNRIVAGMPLGVVVIEGAEFSGSLITARLAMEFGREVFGVPGNVTQPVSFAHNLLIKQGAKLVVNAEDVIEELSTPVRAAPLKVERPESEQRNLLAAAALGDSEKKLYELLNVEETRHIDELVENSGLNSSEVLATLFDLEMKGVVRQLVGQTIQ
jgi:DNA processing protein